MKGNYTFDISLRSTKVLVHVTDVCHAIHTLLMHKVYNQIVAVGGENVSVESIINVIQSKRTCVLFKRTNELTVSLSTTLLYEVLGGIHTKILLLNSRYCLISILIPF